MYHHSEHLTNVLQISKRKETIAKAIEVLTKCKEDGLFFDTIAFMGLSGSLIGPAIADALDLEMIVVRKSINDCHSPLQVEGWCPANTNYIIIDDLVATGDTVKKIIGAIGQTIENANCVGIYLYADAISQILPPKTIMGMFGFPVLA